MNDAKANMAPYGSLDYLPSGLVCPKIATPSRLVMRMPSADVAAKVGGDKMQGKRNVRVVRRNAA